MVNPKQGLGDLYLKISSPSDDLEAYQVAQNLVKNNPKHPESLIFLARTALKANLWGEARTHLTNLVNLKGTVTADVYQLFARLELEEKQDLKAAIKMARKRPTSPSSCIKHTHLKVILLVCIFYLIGANFLIGHLHLTYLYKVQYMVGFLPKKENFMRNQCGGVCRIIELKSLINLHEKRKDK